MGSKENVKKKRGDRKDGRWIREVDDLHFIMPYVMPNRTEAEVYSTITADITHLQEYLEKKNEELEKGDRTTLFHCILASLSKCMILYPELNRFICGRRTYQRDIINISFLAKTRMELDAPEAFVFMEPEADWTLSTLSNKINHEIFKARSENNESVPSVISTIRRFPRPLVKLLVGFLEFLNYHGWMPESMSNGDTNFSSVLVTNLGSIGAPAIYHHLNEYGTTSILVAIGTTYKDRDLDGNLRTYIDLGFTIDERIADGLFFSHISKDLIGFLENPETLETAFGTGKE